MPLTRADVKRVLGDIGDHAVAEIVGSDATISDLQEVAAHLALETDVMGELERPLTGRALRIYNMLRKAGEDWDEPD